jgi:hypothetical protein
MTLAAPTAAQEGTEILIVSQSAYVHTITAAFQNGTSADKTTATFTTGYTGQNIRLLAVNLKWTVLATMNVAIS